MATRQEIEKAFQNTLHELGFDTCDIGYLAQAAVRAVHEEILALADEEKNQADAEYNREDQEDYQLAERIFEDSLSDAEADSMTLASAGYGTDEDYGFFGDYPETD